MTITSNCSSRGNEALEFQGEHRKANELFGVHPLGCSLSILVFDACGTLKGGHRTESVDSMAHEL